MVVDSSALLAIYFDEPEKASLAADVVGSTRPRMGTPNLFEASMVVEARQGEAGSRDLDRVLANLELEILAFEAGHVAAARQAFRRFGKGRHRAALNFGDCCAYALAETLDMALLFKGNDFSLTDIKRVR
ncbi:MAG: type II toxin-antitoxin system VapC family toxin [Reyranella sp.]